MWFVGIGLVLLLLKWSETGPVAGWSWWLIFVPFVCAVIWWSYADSTGYYQRKAMEKMDAKRKERVAKNLESLGIDARKRKRKD